MNVFLGDFITLLNLSHNDEFPTVVSGQVKGIVLKDNKQIERVYILGIEEPLFMDDGWKFQLEVEGEDD